MESARPVYQVLALLWISAFIQSIESHDVSHNVRSVNLSAPETFIESVFDEFGSNNSMNSKQFESLLKELNIGSQSSNEQTSKDKSEAGKQNGESKCYSAKTLLDSFSVDSNGLNPGKFEKICPAIVQQIESKACLVDEEEEEHGEQSAARAWGFGFLSVTIISCASLLGAFVVPFISKTFYKILLLFMVSLAVGVLSGSGFFHLIPHEKNEAKSELLGTGIAEVQLQLYNVQHDHHLSHHSFGDFPDVHNGQVEKGSSNNNPEVTVKTGEKRKVAPVAWMIIIGDGLHNFIDGLAIGASYSSSTYIGFSTSLAIFCEELPHELGDFAILLNAGMSYKMAMGYNFLSACSCYLGLVIGLILGTKTSAVMWIYPLAGGMFIYISLVDMLEEASEMSARIGQDSIRKNLKTFALQNFGMLFGLLIMFILGVYKKKIKSLVLI
ncbi:hypothetical protein OS493_004759 [Desmophyllum pertusum]|uniref:Zinc transporter ZIP4/12 EF-hand domain-containing protein n=1 Tax=Desmophyllum pertusum TaxID=174260 RepID=A0A9W9ZGZ3_9CNID|nr:hypothetical protein OS493_004759 [Desmophyllum pertusum]